MVIKINNEMSLLKRYDRREYNVPGTLKNGNKFAVDADDGFSTVKRIKV
jgi:hypothetical protein